MKRLRIITYNVRGCLGMDGIRSVDRIAEVLYGTGADVLALQELFVEGEPGGDGDQPSQLARRLGMQCLFTATVVDRQRRYGHGLLSRFPVRLVRHGQLPTFSGRQLERRSALWASVQLSEQETMSVVTTHLGLDRRERAAQARALLGPDWLGRRGAEAVPAVVCGDLNCLPASRVYRGFARGYRDVQRAARGWHRTRATWPAWIPLLRIDHMFVSRDVEVESARVSSTPAARRASDHRPLIATLRIHSRKPRG